jgi:hypothetical protein
MIAESWGANQTTIRRPLDSIYLIRRMPPTVALLVAIVFVASKIRNTKTSRILSQAYRRSHIAKKKVSKISCDISFKQGLSKIRGG